MDLKKKHVDFIDRLREASKQYDAVVDLLMFLDASIVIEDCGCRAIDGAEESLEYLKAALIAAKFVMADLGLLEEEAEE